MKGVISLHENPVWVPFKSLPWLTFDLSTLYMTLITMVIVFLIAWLGARGATTGVPRGLQNIMEWLVDFVRNVISIAMDLRKGERFLSLGLTLIMFIFVANMLGLIWVIQTEHTEPLTILGTEVVSEEMLEEAEAAGKHGVEVIWWKSPTADASVTLGLSVMIILLSHILGIRMAGPKAYLKHYVQPYPVFLPINLIEEVSNTLTLGLRLFGNIFAGEVLIAVILMMGVAGIVPMIVWQGFSVFVGAVQSFIFTVLSMVYISRKIEHSH